MKIENLSPGAFSYSRSHRNRLWLFACLAIAILVGVRQASVSYAAPGDLDSTFSGDGLQTTDFFGASDQALAVAIQPDGKIVAAGAATTTDGGIDFALARYNSNGSLDSTFDTDGKVTTNFNGGADFAGAVAILPNGKILAAGVAASTAGDIDFALARYNPDGSLDTTFSGDGKQTTDFDGGDDYGLGMVIQPDGKIVQVGFTFTSPGHTDFALARYNPNGNLDTTFSGDGKQTTDFGGSNDGAEGVARQSDGKIVVVGDADPSGTSDFALARYNSDGSLDTTFSGDGMLTADFDGGNDYAYDVVIDTDGAIIVDGSAQYSTDVDFALAKYLSDGTPDSTFGTGGKVHTDFGSADDAYALLLQPDHKLIAVGYSGTTNFALARYTSNGTLDTTFSGDGKVLTSFLGLADAGALQSDGKIVAAGFSNGDFGLARYQGDPQATPTPTPTRSVTATPTRTPTIQHTATRTATSVQTSTSTPTSTRTANATRTSTGTPSPTATSAGDTNTPMPSSSPTMTHTPTAIVTPSNTNTPMPTQTPGGLTATPVASNTNTGTATPPPTSTGTATLTFTPLPTTPLPTQTSGGATATSTPMPTNTRTDTPLTTSTEEPGETVTATTSPTSCPIQFTDVPTGQTFYAYIRCLACRGIVSGYTDPSRCPSGIPCFLPGDNVTRGQMAKFVSNSAGYSDTIPPTQQTFTDVPPSSTFWVYIERAYLHGIINGYTTSPPCTTGAPCFLPNNNVTRGQTAKFVSNAAGYIDLIPPTQQTFTDVPPSSTFWVYVERAYLHSVVNGYTTSPPCATGSPCFQTGNNVTRGQTAKFISNAFFPSCSTPILADR